MASKHAVHKRSACCIGPFCAGCFPSTQSDLLGLPKEIDASGQKRHFLASFEYFAVSSDASLTTSHIDLHVMLLSLDRTLFNAILNLITPAFHSYRQCLSRTDYLVKCLPMTQADMNKPDHWPWNRFSPRCKFHLKHVRRLLLSLQLFVNSQDYGAFSSNIVKPIRLRQIIKLADKFELNSACVRSSSFVRPVGAPPQDMTPPACDEITSHSMDDGGFREEDQSPDVLENDD